jgi:hypothetical protein
LKLVQIPDGIVEEDIYEEVQHENEEEEMRETILAEEKNTNVKMLLRLRIPRKNVEVPIDGESSAAGHEVAKSGDSSTMKQQVLSAKSSAAPAGSSSHRNELSPPSSAQNQDGESSEQPKTKMVEMECEQEDRTLAVVTRLDPSLPFAIQVIHQAASRFHRKEIA